MWLLALVFGAFWLSCFTAGFYVIFSIIAACIPGCDKMMEVMLLGVQLAGRCSKFMVEGTSLQEAFNGS